MLARLPRGKLAMVLLKVVKASAITFNVPIDAWLEA
jgi:hypothetical protein